MKASCAVSQKRCRTAVSVRLPRCAAAASVAICLAAAPASAQDKLSPGSFKAFASNGVEARVSDFSGQPVPRYASLRYEQGQRPRRPEPRLSGPLEL